MATLKELKELSRKALEKHHEYERRIKALLEKRKETCKHEKTKIIDQDYMEQGRMSSPIRWQELVCCRCKKVLATRGEKTEMSLWQPEEGVSLNGIMPVNEVEELVPEVNESEAVQRLADIAVAAPMSAEQRAAEEQVKVAEWKASGSSLSYEDWIKKSTHPEPSKTHVPKIRVIKRNEAIFGK